MADASLQIRSLTRIDENTGRPFERRPEVEEQIRQAVGLDARALVERASIQDDTHPFFLKEECLVYLIREYHRQERPQLANDLTQALNSRPKLISYMRRELRKQFVDEERLEDAESDVVLALFSKILALDNDKGDFAQVSFWTFLGRKVSDVARKHLTQQKKDQRLRYPAWVRGSAPDSASEMSSQDSIPEPESNQEVDEALLQQEALGVLTGHHLELAKLLQMDWPIESKDPSIPTISLYFGKTSRTIRNWMREARQIVDDWQRGQV